MRPRPELLRVALTAGLLEGVAVARYDVLMADFAPANLLRALAALAAIAALHLGVWIGLDALLRLGVRQRLSLPLVFSLWVGAAALGRTLLHDRTVKWGWWLLLAGLLLAWAPVWRRLAARPVWRDVLRTAAVLAIVVAFQLGRLPDVSYPGSRQVLFWATTAVVAGALLESLLRRPRVAGAALVAAAAVVAAATLWPAGAKGPNVLWILVDTARRDHIAPFDDAARTPEIARLASEGVAFTDAVTVVPKTPASVASFFTGLYPTGHGVRSLYENLAADRTTIAEVLEGRGFHTTALINNAWLSRGRGFAQGFESFHGYYEVDRPYGVFRYVAWVVAWDQLSRGRIRPFDGQTSARALTDRAIEVLEEERRRPFFAYVHYFEPHWPYFPPPELARDEGAPPDGRTIVNYIRQTPIGRGRMIFDNPLPESENEAARRLYRAEVRDTMSEIGRLIDWLDASGRAGETLVVFTADHGHALGEHDYWFHHGEFLYDDSLRIPLVLRWPGRLPAGRTVEAQVRSIDLAPTIVGLVSGGGFPGGDGRSLARYWEDPASPSLPAFVESDVKMFRDNRRRPIPGVVGKLRAVRDGRFKLTATPTPDGLRLELFDLRADPGEERDLATEPEWAETRERLLETLFDALPADERSALGRLAAQSGGDEEGQAVSESELELLRSLGYIE